jgi:hypothetical protein
MRVIMPVIIDRAGRNFNADETGGISARDREVLDSGWNFSPAITVTRFRRAFADNIKWSRELKI